MKTLRAQGHGVAWDGFCWTQPMELLWWGLGCVILFMVGGAFTVLLKGLVRSWWQICREMKPFLTKFKGWVTDRFAFFFFFFFFFAHQCQWDISGCQVCKHLSWAVTAVIFMSSVHFPLLLLLVWSVPLSLSWKKYGIGIISSFFSFPAPFSFMELIKDMRQCGEDRTEQEVRSLNPCDTSSYLHDLEKLHNLSVPWFLSN